MRVKGLLFVAALLGLFSYGHAQPPELDKCNIVWTSQSLNSSESMPCGGHDIGMNVWVEKGELLFYLSRSGTFDENNGFLKLGRVRIRLNPNPFDGDAFRQELVLKEGCVKVSGSAYGCSAQVTLWADVHRPVVHVSITGTKPMKAEAIYESWRFADQKQRPGESFANSYKWGPFGDPVTFRDSISFQGSGIAFFHRNRDYTVFDPTVELQGLEQVKDSLFNPLPGLTFGGFMEGPSMQPAGKTSGRYLDTDFEGWKLQSRSPAKKHTLTIYLHTAQTSSLAEWQNGLNTVVSEAHRAEKEALANTRAWWKDFWNRSFIFINPDSTDPASGAWQTGRNYQLFRYMLACNAFGDYPTKFNGGMFTCDPVFTDPSRPFTPDYRNWGGGIHTAQNQRLVYFPMLKSGDFEMMKAQFEFYRRILRNAELRSEVYWGHKGACFTEQMENFGLPNNTEYGYRRPAYFDKGVEYNSWLEYEWDTALEFCLMILETQRYNANDIADYMPLIESCLAFFNEHYQYLAKIRGSKTLDENDHLVLYPGSAGETYKMAYNANSTIAALKTVLARLLELPAPYLTDSSRSAWKLMLSHIPPLSFRECGGYVTLAPARLWERVNNTETMQLYPVFPWGIYGVGKPGLDTAINTWKYDPDAIRFRSHSGWKQDNIFAARLGLTEEAADLAVRKLRDSGRRFPAFWGPGFDWTPDHNWGGSGMIGLQEMLMQVDGKKIFLLPAWPANWDVHFKLHAPYNTTVEGIVRHGKVEKLEVLPVSRISDVVIL
ncbi:MAG: hypothetical protein H6R34_650 [Bacteroidetes bacterium]|nr:hypothetical protein [Bacteroidota bacterium]